MLKVESKFPRDYQGAVLRNHYFVFDNVGDLNLEWKKGRGIVNFKGNLIIGTNSQFKSQLQKGDKIYIYNLNKIQEFFNVANSNPKVIFTEEEMNNCIVDKVISNYLLLTKSPCKKPFDHKGDYFIAKKNDITGKSENLTPSIATPPTSPVDFETVETLNILRSSNLFYHKQFLFHEGFLIKSPTVFRMKIEKGQSKINSVIRIILGTNINTYHEKKYNPENDFELLINSESGAMIKKVNGYENTQGQSLIEFYDTEIRSFFQDQILIDIIIQKDAVYLSTVDDDNDSSIKIKFPLPQGVKISHIYFDLLNSDNVYLKDIRKLNFIEQKYLVNIFFYEKRLLLTPNAYFIEEMTEGDYCPDSSTPRRSTIEYRCDRSGVYDLLIESVVEEKVCDYRYIARSKFLCNPIDIQLSKIEKSIAKTRCVVQNKNYNFSDEVYFRNVEV